MFKIKKNKKGFSIIEIIVGIAVFSLSVSSIATMVVGAYGSNLQAGLRSEAHSYAVQGIEAARSIRERGWNLLQNGNHGLTDTSGYWEFSGASDDLDPFTRVITIEDVYRDASGDIAPSGTLDLHTKKIISQVTWQTVYGVTNDVTLTAFATNWRTEVWPQTDWSGGDGQAIWSDTTKFWSETDIDYSTSGEIKLQSAGAPCAGYNWTFDTPGNYSYDSGKIEVTGGYAQLKEITTSVSGDLTNQTFDSNANGWTYADWQQDWYDPNANGAWTGSYGNPPGSIYVDVPASSIWGSDVGGYWEQSFTVTADTLTSAQVNFDGRVLRYDPTPNTFQVYVFVDSSSGAPTIGNEVWSSGEITGTSGWTSIGPIDASSKITGSGTYYFKIAVWTETGFLTFDGPYTVLFDNINLHWEGTTSSYPTDNPSINPTSSYSPSSIDSWTAFTETANKNGGEIYYQISDDDGTTWYYWDGSSWSAAGATDYNTASVINDNIWKFSSANGKIMFKAFLESDGSQLVQLDEVGVDCANLQMEAGTVTTDENWALVALSNVYESPVLVASYYEDNNTAPASVRIRNLDQDSFEARLQNPSGNNLDSDKITYFVIEEGRWTIDGIKVEAHKYDTSTVGSSGSWSFDSKTFDHTFSSDPIVLHQVMTNNDSDWISTYVSRDNSRTNPPDTDGMRIALNGAEAFGSHGTETIGWIAIERDQTGVIDSTVDFETFRTTDSVRGHDNGCYGFSYQNTYVSPPLVLGFLEEMDGGNGGWSVTCSNTEDTASFHIEEDQVGDNERVHATETNSFIAFEESFSYSTGGFCPSHIVDDTQTEFDQGSYSDTQWDTDHVELTPTGQSNGSGAYTSQIFNSGSVLSQWNNISWMPTAPYGKELPNNGGSESAYTEGNINMSDNQVLFHLNESSGTITDSSGGGNDGSYNGSLYSQSAVLNTGIGFDGNNDDITTTADLNQWLGGTSSLSFWINTTQSGNDTAWLAPGITGIEESGGTDDIFWGYITSSGYIGIQAGNTAGATSTTVINDGNWHHIVFTRNATNGETKVYIDGTLEDTQTSDTGTKTNSFYDIGRIYDTAGSHEYFAGTLDELAIWDEIIDSTIVENIYKRGALDIKFQVRSCNDASCSGESFIGPDGTGGDYYWEADNDTVATPSFALTNVSDNQYFQYQATFETNDSSYTPELESVTIDYYGPCGAGGYSTLGTLESSAFDTGSSSSFNIIEWDETPYAGGDIKLQVKTAQDSGGSPINWSPTWCGPEGEDGDETDFFTDPSGEIIHPDHNTDQWIKYFVTMTSDGGGTPVLEETRVYYVP